MGPLPAAITLLLLLASVAAVPAEAAVLASVTIDATIQTEAIYTFKVDPGVLIEVVFNNLQPNANVDNLALIFRDASPQEVFILYVKTSGNLVLRVPIAGVTTDQLIGSWQQLGSVTVRYWADRLQVLDPNGSLLYEVQGSFPALADIRAVSSGQVDPTTGSVSPASAFTAGTIDVVAQDDPALLTASIMESVNAILPAFVMLLSFALVLGVLTKVLNTFNRAMR